MKRKTATVISLLIVLTLAVSSFLIIPELKKRLYPREYTDLVTEYASEFDVPEQLVYAVILTESGFDPEASSHAGAVGLMQLTPVTYDWLNARLDDVTSDNRTLPDVSIKYGTYYLSYLYERFGDWETALAAYNAGPTRVSDWLKDTRYSDDGTTLKEIPFDETKNYVKKVIASRDQYQEIYYNNGDK